MKEKLFSGVASREGHPNYRLHIQREIPMYQRRNDIRSPYERDYTRILHSLAYRRLKHKTQVFFNIDNDHICTRMEHVQHVESVSCTIAKFLGLNTDLTRAVAMGHDLGHAPFGHEGEIELTALRKRYGMDRFWHERNSLRMIDDIEVLEDAEGFSRNLDLTYAVRDGIISHCGEVDSNILRPREELIDLSQFNEPGQFQPFTWEGCVVKISDKIAYLGRDIEDAIRLDFLGVKELAELRRIARKHGENEINTTVIIHNFIISICENSSPESGIRLSEEYSEMLNEVRSFNLEKIYLNPKFRYYKEYVALMIRSIFDFFMEKYKGSETPNALEELSRAYPLMIRDFTQHLYHYSNIVPLSQADRDEQLKFKNKRIYGELETEQIYAQAIIDYISGMTDKYAQAAFNELLSYR
ncbi:MAG: HD domain-containing protein [Ruminococcus sp.]|nr:HD domain-containing protein [Ruminococcus sp.]